jgi:hypothetical protein
MAKADNDKRADTKDNPRARARAVARTQTSEAMAKPNEGEVTETAIDDLAEIRKETLAKANDIEAAEMREDAGTETDHEQHVRQHVYASHTSLFGISNGFALSTRFLPSLVDLGES